MNKQSSQTQPTTQAQSMKWLSFSFLTPKKNPTMVVSSGDVEETFATLLISTTITNLHLFLFLHNKFPH